MTPAAEMIDPGNLAQTRRFCTFVVAGRAFAVDASAVQEVFRGTVTTPVPRSGGDPRAPQPPWPDRAGDRHAPPDGFRADRR